MTRYSRTEALLVVGLLAAAILPYWGVWNLYFIRDDWDWLDRAQMICASPSFLLKGSQEAFNYLPLRPMLEMTFAVTWAMVGMAPWAHHGVQLGLHLLNVWLVTRVASAWSPNRAGALLAGILFALWWPAREGVLHLYGRTQMLGLTFGLLAAWGHRLALDGPAPAARRWPWALLAALLTYEGAAPLLVWLPLSEKWLTGRIAWRRYRTAAGLAGLWAAWQVGMRLAHPGSSGAWAVGKDLPVQWLLGTASVFGPVPGHAAWRGLFDRVPPGFAALGWVSAGLLFGLVLRAAVRGSTEARLAIAWAAGWLALPSGFSGGQAGRYLYPAVAGAAALLAGWIVRMARGASPATARGGWKSVPITTACLGAALATAAIRVSVAEGGRRTAAVRRIVSDLQRLAPDLPDGRIPVMVDAPDPDLPLHKQRLNRVARMTVGRRWEFDVAEPGRPVEAAPGAVVLSYRGGRLSLLKIP